MRKKVFASCSTSQASTAPATNTLTCTSVCTHVSNAVYCVASSNATGDLLGSDPGASGHSEYFPPPWCSRQNAHLMPCERVENCMSFQMCVCLTCRRGSHAFQPAVSRRRVEEMRMRKEGKKKKKTAFVHPRSSCSPETTAPLLFALFI